MLPSAMLTVKASHSKCQEFYWMSGFVTASVLILELVDS